MSVLRFLGRDRTHSRLDIGRRRYKEALIAFADDLFAPWNNKFVCLVIVSGDDDAVVRESRALHDVADLLPRGLRALRHIDDEDVRLPGSGVRLKKP